MWLIVTILVFFFARWVAKKARSPFVNPLLVCIAILIPLLLTLKVPFDTYYADNRWISYLLQPAVVALAFPLYEQLPQIRANWRIITLACGIGSVMSMLSASLIAVYMHADITLIAALMAKSVTTPIAMEVASNLGGEPSVAAIMVLLVGLFGAIMAYPIYNLLNISHPIAKGLTMGTVSHALGTATCAEKDPRDAAFSSLALVVCGVITSILAPTVFSLALWLSNL
ncbi:MULTISPECIES: CidB/LrgB family autolysis modulator [Vibrio]|uniref:CidB/LrgB family autolysis modulator n=1 Tax=Vibrio ostreae TaxID=2841925 RepID=A0A975UBP3_9VIBR|nr:MULTISPECIES: CidB/LrgB family autolysis modulator [Vibrio]QXO18913.1 CidB/LrgB family autolysis modulator [Vibrio ostreae]WGY46755.1 CidB/LrgB family autolysis modulator [Vibrio sp. ABG19]